MKKAHCRHAYRDLARLIGSVHVADLRQMRQFCAGVTPGSTAAQPQALATNVGGPR